jgi:hypothetical protein
MPQASPCVCVCGQQLGGVCVLGWWDQLVISLTWGGGGGYLGCHDPCRGARVHHRVFGAVRRGGVEVGPIWLSSRRGLSPSCSGTRWRSVSRTTRSSSSDWRWPSLLLADGSRLGSRRRRTLGCWQRQSAHGSALRCLVCCQDLEFDRAHGLHSIPVHFGVARSLIISRLMHVSLCCASRRLVQSLSSADLSGGSCRGRHSTRLRAIARSCRRPVAGQNARLILNGYVGILYLAATAAAMYVH